MHKCEQFANNYEFMAFENDKKRSMMPSDKVKCLLKRKHFIVNDFIEKGSTSQVFKVSQNGYHFAAKVIDHKRISILIKEYFLPNELRILRQLNHPNIVKTMDIIEDDDFTIIINEYATDGDLISYIQQNLKPNLVLAKRWIRQITNGLVYLHLQGIAHRDIKADNVLLCNGIAKLTDFTYAQYCLDPITKNVIPCTKSCGTLEYKAPEMLFEKKPFDPFIADCFSLGVLIYTLVTSEFPFGTRNETKVSLITEKIFYDRIQNKQWTANNVINGDKRLYSLIKQLLNPDVHERIHSTQILGHPWFSE